MTAHDYMYGVLLFTIDYEGKNSVSLDRTTFSESHVHKLERWIDEMDNHLPELKNFILPVSLSRPCN